MPQTLWWKSSIDGLSPSFQCLTTLRITLGGNEKLYYVNKPYDESSESSPLSLHNLKPGFWELKLKQETAGGSIEKGQRGSTRLCDKMTALHIFSAILGSVLILSFALYRRIASKPLRRHTSLVLVLGDVGRSPRMMYHAHSFARHQYFTTLVGYTDTPPIPALLESPHVKISGIANPPRPLLRLPWIARAPIRVLWQILSVLKICLWDAEWYAEVMVVQNPPSIPTLALAQLIGWMSGTKILIDWHNTGYSILAMRTGANHPLCKIART